MHRRFFFSIVHPFLLLKKTPTPVTELKLKETFTKILRSVSRTMAQFKGAAKKVSHFESVEDDSAFPHACDKCLGPSHLLKVTKQVNGKRCGVCQKPCTVFTWSIAANARQRTTVICRACATSKSKCQSCLCVFDEKNRRRHDRDDDEDDGYSSRGAGVDLARHQQKLCTLFAQNKCTRGEHCPFRHEMPKPQPLQQKPGGGSIQERFFSEQPKKESNSAFTAPTVAAAAKVAAPASKTVAQQQQQKPKADNKTAGGGGFGFDWMGRKE